MRYIYFTPEGHLAAKGLDTDNRIPRMAVFNSYAEIPSELPSRKGFRSLDCTLKEQVFQYRDEMGAHCSLKRNVRIRAIVRDDLLLNGILNGSVQMEPSSMIGRAGIVARFVIMGVTRCAFRSNQTEETMAIVVPVARDTIFNPRG